MPNIRYSGRLSGTAVKAVHMAHYETLYMHLLLPTIEDLKKEGKDDPLHDLDLVVAEWAVAELMTVGFVSVFHLWERQFREFLIEQGARPDATPPKQKTSEGLVAYARKVMSYFDVEVNEHIWAELECAADVVNAFKHGPGQKCDKAMRRHPAYFYAPEDQRHIPMVVISRPQLSSLVRSAVAFWSNLPVEIRYETHGA